jgi:hypothetical protein
MDQRTLMLAGLITESEYRKSKENQSSLNENDLKSKIKNMIRESLSEMDMNNGYTAEKEEIKNGNYDFDTAYVWLEDQGLNTNQIDSIMSQLDAEGYEFPIDEAKKKDKEEEPEEELGDDLEDMDLEDEPMDDEMMDEEPEGESDLNDIENHLDSALEAAKQSGDEKLITQIENTITMLTRMQFNK